MRFKKLLCSLLTFSLMTPALFASSITVKLQDQKLSLTEAPILIDNTVYLPIRSFSNALGYTTHYDKAHRQVIISYDATTILTLPIVNSPQEAGVLLQNNKTYMPLRMVSEGLGYSVQWDGKSQTVSLTKATTIEKNNVQQIALDVAECIKNKDYEPITNLFDDTLKAALSSKDIEACFTQLEAVLGPIQSYSFFSTGRFDEYEEADVLLKYAQTTVSLAIVINEQNQISGFHTNQYTPELSLPTGAIEKEITFGASETYPLSGTLTLPSKTGSYPVVILVHGSGPLDRDETVYNTKLFRDIAYGLAKQGIATFRYDKRTYTYAEELTNSTSLTLDEEVIDDVLAAINLMESTKGVNKEQVYVLGHSLGGMLIPMIDEKLNENETSKTTVAGYIMASAPARALPDVILEQYKYLTSLDTSLSDADKETYMMQVQYFVDAAKNATLSNAGDSLGLAGFNDIFWATLNTYNQQNEAKEITIPTLITQGERDYQVTMEDFKLWQSTLKENDNFTLKSYPNLNHLYVSGDKTSTPDEYFFDSFADENYINDLATWIKAQNVQ